MVIPVHIWAYAFRIWLAAVIALYVAFWLQLGGASSAAVTVAILAQPTRGAALAKAANRIVATLIGATMSVVIAGVFAGERIGMLGAFICWICICVFVASYLRGYQAYAAVLSGYTVAIITLVNIDTPQNVFTTMTDRMAAITIGILCVTLINDVFGSPPVWRGLERRINDIWADIRSYVRVVLSGDEEKSEHAGELLAQISGLRDQVDIVAHDMADGQHRAAGARSAMLALVEIVQQVRLLRLLAHGDPLAVTIRDQCLAVIDDHHSEAPTSLTKLREIELSRPDVVIGAVWQLQQAIRFVESKSLLDDGLLSLREGLEPARDIRLPHRGDFAVALGNATRIGIALVAGATFLVFAGWPASVAALTITAILCALSTTMPSPSKFAVAAMVSFALASVSAGIVRFYVLTESQDFVRLAVAIAPVVFFGCLLSVRPAIGGIGLIMNIIFLVLLAPSNPQVYNPLTFYSECVFVAFALGVVLLASRLVWPLSALDKQHAVVKATQESLTTSVSGTECSLPALEFDLASRIADYVTSAAGAGRPRRQVLKALLSINDLSLAAASAHLHLVQSSDDPAIRSRIGQLQRALWSGNSRRLFAGARSVLRRMRGSQIEAREALLAAATDLWTAGLVLAHEQRRIRHFCDHGSVRKGDVPWSLH
ncbi:FUSC family protein [Bradyrhizobium diazoefficiens]|uniref:FUSC family protein n=1 Tax=Bradyrhizobium diazoefficiens TaxID=1355477 RepID=UPI001B6DB7EC|nr:putative membrane protein YccC [Bradyrhizobium japonicum]